jgi:hypothetical protein
MADAPKYKPEDVIVKSGELAKLTRQYDVVRQRVGDEVVNTVVNGPARLQASYSAQTDTHGDKVATSKGQHQSRAKWTKYLMDRRKAISKAFPKDDETKELFGIGMPVNPDSPDTVHAGYERFITAGEAAPEKLAAAFIPAEDIAKMKEYRDQFVVGRTNQSGLAASAKDATLARKKLQSEIEAAMIKIVSAATLLFEDRPDVVALFKGTLPKARRGSRKAEESTDTTPSSESESE